MVTRSRSYALGYLCRETAGHMADLLRAYPSLVGVDQFFGCVPGDDIKETCRFAVEVSAIIKADVFFRFLTVYMSTVPSKDPQALAELWHRLQYGSYDGRS